MKKTRSTHTLEDINRWIRNSQEKIEELQKELNEEQSDLQRLIEQRDNYEEPKVKAEETVSI